MAAPRAPTPQAPIPKPPSDLALTVSAPKRPSTKPGEPEPGAKRRRLESNEYFPDEGKLQVLEDPALTTRREKAPSGRMPAVSPANPPEAPQSPARSSPAGLAPPEPNSSPAKASPPSLSSPPKTSPPPKAGLPPPPAPSPTAAKPVSEVPGNPVIEADADADLFDRAAQVAREERAAMRTQPELPAGPPSEPVGCPVCGNRFQATDPRRANCPECGTTFDPGDGRVLGSTVAEASAPFSTPPNPAAPPQGDALIGRVLGGCKIDRKIGEGGMGAVYHALQLSLERSVAIKVLPADLARNRNFISRFEREAKSLARINHPNILHVYDFGDEPALGIYYMVMEFVDGKDLGEILHRRTVLDQLETLDALRQAALGLETAAEKGVIHRDIKPDNLMLTGDGVVKVSDFGLAKALQDEKEVTVTQIGVRVGTPAFMSPEQCDGVEVDWRSDVYNLGCTAWLAMAGQLPYDGDTPFSIMLKHKNDPIPSLSEANPRVDPRVDALIAKMLAKRPADRGDSWRMLIDEIESLMISISGSQSILRKTQGPMRALIANPDAPRSRPKDRDRQGQGRPARSSPAKPTGPKPPADIPDWLKPVDSDSAPLPPPAGVQATPPQPPAPAVELPPVEPPPRTSISGTREAPASSSGSSRMRPQDPAKSGTAPRPQIAEDQRASRVGKRFNAELEMARSRSRHAMSDSAVETAERLESAGQLEQAAAEFARAATLAGSSERATTLQNRAKTLKARTSRQRLVRTVGISAVVLGAISLAAWQAPPSVHRHLASSAVDRARVMEDRRLRRIALESAIDDWGQPWGWYTAVFPAYSLPVIAAARAEVERLKEPPPPPPTPRQPPSATRIEPVANLTVLEKMLLDPAIPWQEVLTACTEFATKPGAKARVEAIRQEVAQQIASLDQRLAAVTASRVAGHHAEALGLAVALRAERPRIGDRLAELPLSVRLVVTDQETGQAVTTAKVTVDGVAILDPAGADGLRLCRSVKAETIVDIAAPGLAPARVRIPAQSGSEERLVPVPLAPAPRWRQTLGPAVAWTSLHPLTGSIVVHRPDRVTVLSAASGEPGIRLNPPTASAFTTTWLAGTRGAVGTESGALIRLPERASGTLTELHRGLGSLLAASERDSAFRTDRKLLLVIERRATSGQQGESAVLRALDGNRSQLWQHTGLSVAALPPAIPAAAGGQAAGGQDGRLVVFDDKSVLTIDEDGTKAKRLELPGRRTGEPVPITVAGAWLVPTEDGPRLVRLGADGAAVLSSDNELAALGNAQVAVVGEELVATRPEPSIELYRWQDGGFARRWSRPMAAPAATPPAIGSEVVAVVDRSGVLLLLRRSDGQPLRRFTVGATSERPLIHGDLLVIAEASGSVAAYPISR
ncbi:hypothetical protein LBMAG53_19100 [Planctomycetota bacterium]|nr:hypothetical protein LBMAG53_19100 [Planctomycetota bacterium]